MLHSTLPPDIKLVVFDMAGTTVADLINGKPLVELAMVSTFKEWQIEVTTDMITDIRGLEKKEALAKIYVQCKSVDLTRVPIDQLYRTFCTHLER